jgi:hypothetical protein
LLRFYKFKSFINKVLPVFLVNQFTDWFMCCILEKPSVVCYDKTYVVTMVVGRIKIPRTSRTSSPPLFIIHNKYIFVKQKSERLTV